ncbi:MAG: ATP-binding protein [Candidatus Dojkabacteria bacterium]|nr:MAG: ATP-binding protein [Candidatus Dojkabacteria bacterium]
MGLIPFIGKKKIQKPEVQNGNLAQSTASQAKNHTNSVSVQMQGQPIAQENKAVQMFSQGVLDVKDIIAPPAIEIDFNHLLVGGTYFRTFFATGFPRWVGANWLAPLINFEKPLTISTFYYPVDSALIMQRLKRKIAEMQATLNLDIEAGKIPDPSVKVALRDAEDLQDQIASGNEKFFHFGLYVTARAKNLKELERISRNVESTLSAIGVIVKIASLQQEEGFITSMPLAEDRIHLTRNMDTTSLATTFPFVSSELSMDDGIMYGVNKHNKSLIVFDRFQMPNANMVIFATSGAGKSYFVKLEAMRSLMLGTDVIIIDPEKEYEKMTTTIGGEYISFSQDGDQKLNPFELSGMFDKDEDELRFKILFLQGLIKIMVGGSLSPIETAILDRALILTYKEKGISPDPATQRREPPLLEDLYKVLNAMAEPEAHNLAQRLERYLKGSAAGIFDRRSNVEIKNTFTVFSIRDLTDEMRPIAMAMMLDYIWTRVKKDRRQRILIIDEAWWMMQYPDAARFVYSVAKRARKYALGLTTISQDVEDFLDSDFGKAVVTNSSIQILLKQSPAAVDRIKEVFYLSDGERDYLLSAGVGEGLFFAGNNHVAMQVIASENEHNLITTNPKELLKKEAEEKALAGQAENAQPARADLALNSSEQ